MTYPSILFVFLSLLSGGLKNNKTVVKTTPAQSEIAKWEVSAPDASRMIDAFSNCTRYIRASSCRDAKKISYNKIKDSILMAYGIEDSPDLYVKARYTSLADAERYRRARGIPSGNASGLVRGYTTRLLRVEYKEPAPDNGASFASVFYAVRYYDVSLICPPPDGTCD